LFVRFIFKGKFRIVERNDGRSWIHTAVYTAKIAERNKR
jgi:hypothetical protein